VQISLQVRCNFCHIKNIWGGDKSHRFHYGNGQMQFSSTVRIFGVEISGADFTTGQMHFLL